MLLSFATAVAVTFTVSEIMQMSGHRVAFTTLTAPSVSSQALLAGSTGTQPIGESALSVFLGTEEIVIGSAAALKAPRPNAQVVLLPRHGWQEIMAQRILASAAGRELFPSKTLGIALVGSDATLAGYTELMQLIATVRQLNGKLGGRESDPVASYFFDVHSGLQGVN